jgi:hypothetical protein
VKTYLHAPFLARSVAPFGILPTVKAPNFEPTVKFGLFFQKGLLSIAIARSVAPFG